MKKWLLLICFLINSYLFAVELRLKDKLAEAEPGSYIVTEQNKNFTLFHVHDRNNRYLIIEEVTIPASRFARNPMPWRIWFENGAPGHTSWIMSQVNVQTGRFEETFSFTHKGWVDLSDSNPFLTTLLNLRFQFIPENNRKRIGSSPGHNKPDYRPLWTPLLIVEGKRVPHIPFTAWRARWPSDGSELARKHIEIYIPYDVNDASIPAYPTYFPYWIEVDGKIGSAKMRIIDSGTGLHSPKQSLPLRRPELIGEGKIQNNGLAFYLKSPSYYQEFFLIAQESSDESSDFFAKPLPLPCETIHLDKDLVCLFVSYDVLNASLTSNENYIFSISPKENPGLFLEYRNPINLSQIINSAGVVT